MKYQKTVLTVAVIAILVALIAAIPQLGLTSRTPVIDSAEAAGKNIRVELKWVIKLGGVSGSSINAIRLGSTSSLTTSTAMMMVLTNKPAIYFIKVKDGSIQLAKENIRLPYVPGETKEYIDGDPDKAGFVYIDVTRAPKLVFYNGNSDDYMEYELRYITNPEPTVVTLSHGAGYVVVGDIKGYLALYEIKGL